MAHATTQTAPSKTGHDTGGHGVGRYVFVWAILLVFTVLTVITGRIDLGSLNIYIALTIATIKASLVIWFFMHMNHAAATNRIVFVTSFIFMMVMIFGVFGDLWTRSQMSLPNHVPSTEGPEIPVFEGGSLPPPGHHE